MANKKRKRADRHRMKTRRLQEETAEGSLQIRLSTCRAQLFRSPKTPQRQ